MSKEDFWELEKSSLPLSLKNNGCRCLPKHGIGQSKWMKVLSVNSESNLDRQGGNFAYYYVLLLNDLNFKYNDLKRKLNEIRLFRSLTLHLDLFRLHSTQK